MRWSWKIARIFGIDVYMHWTFLLLIAWVLYLRLAEGAGWVAAWIEVGFVLAVFVCVVLHEFGHALTARRFGIVTRDVTLLPIGGVARLERIPEDPKQELLIAIAGPAVNVVIAAVLFGIVMLARLPHPHSMEWARLFVGGYAWMLLVVNVLLVVFNLLPAFPMDGGRVLRALLATRLPWPRATQIAAAVGQTMAVLFGIAGLFWNPWLLFIAIFVYLGAAGEARMAEVRHALGGARVRDCMITHFRMLRPGDKLRFAVQELLAGAQQDFPVVDEQQRPIGVLLRRDLVQALAAPPADDAEVSQAMAPLCHVAHEDASLEETFARMREADCPAAPVVRDEQVVGLVTLENISEYLMVRSALEQARYSTHPSNPLFIRTVPNTRRD